MRAVRGRFGVPGPGAIWYRVDRPLVEASPVSQAMRAVVARRFRPRRRQNDHRPAVPAGRRQGGRNENSSTSRCPKPRANCGKARPRTDGRWANTFRSSNRRRRKACWTPINSRACSIPPISNWAKRPNKYSTRSNEPNPSASSSTVFSRSVSSRKARCVTGARSLAIKHYFARHGSTVVMLDDLTSDAAVDKTVHSIAHGVVHLQELAPGYGAERRRLRVMKYRGQKYRTDISDFTITTGGVNVFPRLVAAEHRSGFTHSPAFDRDRRAQCAFGRRHRFRIEHAHPGARRNWQVPGRHNICDGGDLPRRKGGAVYFRRGTGTSIRPNEGGWESISKGCGNCDLFIIEQVGCGTVAPANSPHFFGFAVASTSWM